MRKLPPALTASRLINEKIFIQTGVSRSNWLGLILFVNNIRIKAKKEVIDPTNYIQVNAKIIELFENYIETNGKTKVANEIENLTMELRAKRCKRS